MSSRHLPIRHLCVLWLLCTLGCTEQRESLHEIDHVTPEHWPVDLADAAEKLESRWTSWNSAKGQTPSDASQSQAEFQDIVGWLPQIAADTDLKETEWNQIFAASETIRQKLSSSSSSQSIQDHEVDAICKLLRQCKVGIDERAADQARQLGLSSSDPVEAQSNEVIPQ